MTVYISRDPDSVFLKHYGVMGMKWGVRKDPVSTASRVSGQATEWRGKASQLRAKRDAYISKHVNSNSAARQLAKASRLRARADKKELKGAKQSTRLLFKNDLAGYRNRTKAIALRRKADIQEQKATGVDHKSNKMLYKAQGYETKAKNLVNSTNRTLSSMSGKEQKKAEKYMDKFWKQSNKFKDKQLNGASEKKLNNIQNRKVRYMDKYNKAQSNLKNIKTAQSKLTK